MRTLEPIDLDTVSFIKNVISNKRININSFNIALRNKEKLLDEYDEAFFENDIERFININQNDVDSLAFASLYSYKAKAFKNLRNQVLTSKGRFNPLCPICGLSEAKTLDHFLPKVPFPEFSIHPRNLIPLCSICNSKKSDAWHTNGKRQFWNAYLNDLPISQFLFCDIVMDMGMPKGQYHIQQGGLSNETFRIISHTFNKLELCNRYTEYADEWIERLKQSVRPLINLMKNNEIISYIIDADNSKDMNDPQRILDNAMVNDMQGLTWLLS